MVAHYFSNINKWGVLTDTFTLMEPAGFYNTLSAALESESIIYINRLDLFKDHVVRTIDEAGFNLKFRATKDVKLESGDASYLINGNGHVLNFSLKHGRSTTFIYNTTNIVKSNDIDLSHIGSGDTFYECVVNGVKIIIDELNAITNVKRSVPFTIGQYAKKLFSSMSGSKLLTDCNEDKIDELTSAEKYIRPSYFGGFVHIFGNMKNGCFHINDGIILDINSLYPYVMKYKPMPFGEATYEEGKPSKSLLEASEKGYVYIFYSINASFKLKDDGIACIKLNIDENDGTYKYGYLDSTAEYDAIAHQCTGSPKKVRLTLTQTDFALLQENYDIIDIDYIDYIWYPTTKRYFDEFVDLLYSKKRESAGAERLAYKLLLNNLSGLMAMLPTHDNQKIDKTEDKFLYEKMKSETISSKSFVNVGAAITAYARYEIINDIRAHKDRVKYSDTDCMQLEGTEIPDDLVIGDEIGQYKVEHTFTDMYYYGKKNYAYIENNEIHMTLAGTKFDDKEFMLRTHNALQNNTEINDKLYENLYIGDYSKFDNEEGTRTQFINLNKWMAEKLEDIPEEKKAEILAQDPHLRYVFENLHSWSYYDPKPIATAVREEAHINKEIEDAVTEAKAQYSKDLDDLMTLLASKPKTLLRKLPKSRILHTYTETTDRFSARLYSTFSNLTSINLDA